MTYSCAYMPTDDQWGENSYCHKLHNGEGIDKSFLLFRSFDLILAMIAVAIIFGPFLGIIKFFMSHLSERKFYEFVWSPFVLDFGKQNVKKWMPEHVKWFMHSKSKGIGFCHSADLDNHVLAEKLDGKNLLKIVKTQEIINFYLLFNELANPTVSKAKLLFLLGKAYKVCRSDSREEIKSIYEKIKATSSADLGEGVLGEGSAIQMLQQKYLNDGSEVELFDVNKKITFANLNQLRKLKGTMEYKFDVKMDEKLYKGYELIKDVDTIHGPGEYNWVKHEGEVLLNNETEFILPKKKCFFDCTESEKGIYENDEDQVDTTGFRKDAAVRETNFADCVGIQCKTDGEEEAKAYLNALPLDEPVRIHKVEERDGRIWGLMREEITYRHPYTSPHLTLHELWFWIPFSGNPFSGQHLTYLEPNYAKNHRVSFPVEENMKHLEFDMPDPQYDLLKREQRTALPDLKAAKCHFDVLDVLVLKTKDFMQEQREMLQNLDEENN